MLIKEYRIPLPLSVEEYKIAQLYMIQKKSRLDSTGEGSGVDIIENCPYKDGPGGSGQYTKKIYHIGNHIPGWLKAIMPKTALQVIEEAWNAYPYTKMKTTCPFVEKFYVDVETKYISDNGSTENVFNLSPAELRNQTVDLIDPVKDPISTSLYSKEEDPLLYVSKKTGRGPLTTDWLQQPQQSVMCAYKRITVEFKYWGMQGKIEQFIHDGLRRPMLMGHRQAWVWQDEWHGLTISDIRELEKETQKMLAKRMGHLSDLNLSRRISDDIEECKESYDTIRPLNECAVHGSTIELLSQESVDKVSRALLVDRGETPTTSWRSFNSSDSEAEYFDAQDAFDSDLSDEEYNEIRLKEPEIFEQNSHSGGSVDSLDSYTTKNEETRPRRKITVGKTTSSDSSTSSTSANSSCRYAFLVLIFHGGNPLETSSDTKSKKNDCERLTREFQNVMQNHYKQGLGRIAFKLVDCPQIFKDVLPVLKGIAPQLMDEYASDPCCSLPSFNFPVSSIPLLAMSSSGFGEMVDATTTQANNVYREFINSEIGLGFSGEVCIVGDCIGGLVAYEAMCAQWSVTSFDTDISSVSTQSCPPELPVNPVIETRRRSFLVKNRHVSDSTPLDDEQFVQNARLSSSEVDIRSPSPKSYERGFSDVDFEGTSEQLPKRWFTERRDSSTLPRDVDRLTSDSSSLPYEALNKFEFEISKFFAFGSPIGLVSLYKRFSEFTGTKDSPAKPACGQFYNLFHQFDPLSSRVEPLILPEFSQMPPVDVPRYQKFPLGDGVNNDVMSCIERQAELFNEEPRSSEKKKVERQPSAMSTSSVTSCDMFSFPVSEKVCKGLGNWWGTERLDYALYNPKSLHQLPLSVLCPLFHSSYWESKDVVAFMIRQILDLGDGISESYGRRGRRFSSFHIPTAREKWLKKRTNYKIKNLASNHRANDAIALEGSPQIIAARFTYGPLDVATLTGERVDVYIMSFPPAGEWHFIDTFLTGSGGRASFTIPEEKRLDVGIYPVKMVTRGDHTTVDCSLAVLPPKTEAVVFSIDGSFSASVSLRGRHPKVQPGAVDVVRHWREKGYLIIYVTSRPDFQKHKVMLWMAEHNFPFGLVSFCGSLSTVDIQRHKSKYLQNLTNNMKVIVHAGYGSTKDVAVYSGIGLEPNAIFVIGKASGRRTKYEKQATFLRDGYASHLASLANDPIAKPPTGNSRISLRRGCFGLPRKNKDSSNSSFSSKAM